MKNDCLYDLIVILGQTATGKTKLAVKIANDMDAEIISSGLYFSLICLFRIWEVTFSGFGISDPPPLHTGDPYSALFSRSGKSMPYGLNVPNPSRTLKKLAG